MGLGPTFCFRVSGMRIEVDLEKLIGPAVTTLGYDLVGIEYVPRGRSLLLRIYVDSEPGITLGDCERVSHQVSGILDVEDTIRSEYTLEVSSPGLDRPLFKTAHYVRFIGHRIRLRLIAARDGRRKFSGSIERVEDEKFWIRDQETDALLEFSLGEIDKANLIPDL